jgi:ferredoxin
VCGACEVKVLSGIPDHRDTVLKPREKELNRKMMICVSRAKSERLVIDVD